MLGLRLVKILPVLMALILVINGHDYEGPCTNDPELFGIMKPCATSTTTLRTTSKDSSEESHENVDIVNSNTTQDSTSLERAHWCRLSNGTYFALNYVFIHNGCSLCQCTKLRSVRCQPFQCMPTYCLDSTMPSRPNGQCCTRCNSDISASNSSCEYNGISFPHGVIIKAVQNKMQCWCQFGNIECRTYMAQSPADLLSDGAAAYIIVIVLLVILSFGLILCCTCTVGFYYYFKRNQHVFQQAYEEYVNSAGWQPVDEGEENVVDANVAEEKRIEAEQYEYTNTFDNTVPPPYAAYNGTHVSEEQKK